MVNTAILDAVVRRFSILIAAARRYGPDDALVQTYARSQGHLIVSEYERAVQIAAFFPDIHDRQ